jgi:hypothetical protein
MLEGAGCSWKTGGVLLDHNGLDHNGVSGASGQSNSNSRDARRKRSARHEGLQIGTICVQTQTTPRTSLQVAEKCKCIGIVIPIWPLGTSLGLA